MERSKKFRFGIGRNFESYGREKQRPCGKKADEVKLELSRSVYF
jgi:hypothetical protein